jgi:circadian clock protein KaiC
VQGAPGVGKTTLGLHFLLEGVSQGERGLYITLSETEDELRAIAASHDWALNGITVSQLSTPEEMLEAQKLNTLFHPAEVELTETVAKVMEWMESTNPARIVFDSLSEVRLLAGDSLRYRRQILSLKQHFAGRNSTVLFLDDGTADNRDSQLQSIAHGVIALEKHAPHYGAARRRLEVLKLRGVDFQTGKHDFVIHKGGLRVFARLVASNHRRDTKRETVPSGVSGLDSLLGGGLDRGSSTLLLGPAGSGKSSVATHFVQCTLQRKERVAYYSFDETLSTFLARASGMGVNLEADDPRLLCLRQVDAGEVSPGEFAHQVQRVVDGDGARLVVIDSLNGYLAAMPNERFLFTHLRELVTYLGQRGVLTILTVAQHGLIGTMHAPLDVTYLADTIIFFRFFEASGQVRKAISVLKKRVGRHEDTIREFQISAEGIRVGSPLSEFRGILTGVPEYSGKQMALLQKQP